MQKFKELLAKNGRSILVDVLTVVGMALVSVGAGLIYLPVGLIIGGLLVVLLAVLLAASIGASHGGDAS